MNEDLKASARNEYLNHINMQKTSTLSIVKYCKQHNLDPNKFYYYKSYRQAASKPKLKTDDNFTQVKIKPELNKLILPCEKEQLKLEAIDPVWLAQFVSNLKRSR